MHVIVCHTPNGGSGKSTLARELAVAASLAGLRVAMADLDPQGTVEGWYRRREATTPTLVRFNPGGSTAELEAAKVHLLVVDTPPGYQPFIPDLLNKASLVLVPVRPTADDLLAAAPIARSLDGHRAWSFVLSQVPPRTRFLAGAVRQLASLGRVAPWNMTFRADYPAAAIEGKAAVEFTGKAAEEARQLWAYAHEFLQEKRNAKAQG